jgi:hypothetical protein
MKQELGPRRTTVLKPQLQEMTANPRATLHTFSLFQQIVSPDVMVQHRNELLRTFALVLKHNDWTKEEAQAAVPFIDWFVGMKGAKNTGNYNNLVRELVVVASDRLKRGVSAQKRLAWKKRVAVKPVHVTNGIGRQAVDAIPRPVLRNVHARD